MAKLILLFVLIGVLIFIFWRDYKWYKSYKKENDRFSQEFENWLELKKAELEGLGLEIEEIIRKIRETEKILKDIELQKKTDIDESKYLN